MCPASCRRRSRSARSRCTRSGSPGPRIQNTSWRESSGVKGTQRSPRSVSVLPLQEIVLPIRWEQNPKTGRLDVGPIGEYIEVVDVDPASGVVYPPVDLDDPNLLAQEASLLLKGIRNFISKWSMRSQWRPSNVSSKRSAESPCGLHVR